MCLSQPIKISFSHVQLPLVVWERMSGQNFYLLEWVFTSRRWQSGVVFGALASMNEVNLRRARLLLRWATVPGSIPGAGHLFRYLANQPPKANSAFHHSGVGKWVPSSAGKTKACTVHSVSGWTRGVQVKLWDPFRTHAIPERLRGATRCYTNPRLPLRYFICRHVQVLEWRSTWCYRGFYLYLNTK